LNLVHRPSKTGRKTATSANFEKGDIVQSIRGRPVMKVLGVRMAENGETIVETVLVHGATDEPAQYAPAALKFIGMDRHEDDDDDGSDDDREP
jgi:hypothetical protein